MNNSELETIVSDDFRRSSQRGHLSLIGGGPGDPDLITVKGLKLLRAADVVLYDRLVPKELLVEASRAEHQCVGKWPGRPKPSQDWINHLIVSRALAGQRVARLKGGDSFVFGRGGEELLAAIRNGIPVDVAPGVTAGIALPGLCGVPVTHRGVARSVALVTAVSDWDHPANVAGQEPQIDHVAHVDTICIYMGLASVGSVAGRLIQLGRDAHTPAMAISNGSTPDEQRVVAPLERLADEIAAAKLVSPVLIVIGHVVELVESQAASLHTTAIA